MPDPFRNFRFEVEIDNTFTRLGFQKVSGLKESTEVIDYREGGDVDTVRKLPGMTSYEPITLERGIATDTDMQDWRRQIRDLDAAPPSPFPTSDPKGDGAVDGFRKTVFIFLRDKSNRRVKRWTVYRAWPSALEVDDLDATANDVLIERLVLQNEGIKLDSLI